VTIGAGVGGEEATIGAGGEEATIGAGKGGEAATIGTGAGSAGEATTGAVSGSADDTTTGAGARSGVEAGGRTEGETANGSGVGATTDPTGSGRSCGSVSTATETWGSEPIGGTIEAGVGVMGDSTGGKLAFAAAAVGITLETWPRSSGSVASATLPASVVSCGGML